MWVDIFTALEFRKQAIGRAFYRSRNFQPYNNLRQTSTTFATFFSRISVTGVKIWSSVVLFIFALRKGLNTAMHLLPSTKVCLASWFVGFQLQFFSQNLDLPLKKYQLLCIPPRKCREFDSRSRERIRSKKDKDFVCFLYRKIHSSSLKTHDELQSYFWKNFKFDKYFVFYYPLSKSESVKFSLIESVICLITDSKVKTIFATNKSVKFHWLISENNIFHC